MGVLLRILSISRFGFVIVLLLQNVVGFLITFWGIALFYAPHLCFLAQCTLHTTTADFLKGYYIPSIIT